MHTCLVAQVGAEHFERDLNGQYGDPCNEGKKHLFPTHVVTPPAPHKEIQKVDCREMIGSVEPCYGVRVQVD